MAYQDRYASAGHDLQATSALRFSAVTAFHCVSLHTAGTGRGSNVVNPSRAIRRCSDEAFKRPSAPRRRASVNRAASTAFHCNGSAWPPAIASCVKAHIQDLHFEVGMGALCGVRPWSKAVCASSEWPRIVSMHCPLLTSQSLQVRSSYKPRRRRISWSLRHARHDNN